MNKLLTTIILLCFSVAANAQAEKPSWIKVLEIDAKYTATEDLSYAQNASYRCSAFNMIFGAFTTRDRPNDGIGETMTGRAFEFLQLGDLFGAVKIMNSGGTPDFDKSTADGDMYQFMIKTYTSWLNYSFANFGEYTGDPDLAAEITFCNQQYMAKALEIIDGLD
jgi:hypothetical protein